MLDTISIAKNSARATEIQYPDEEKEDIIAYRSNFEDVTSSGTTIGAICQYGAQADLMISGLSPLPSFSVIPLFLRRQNDQREIFIPKLVECWRTSVDQKSIKGTEKSLVTDFNSSVPHQHLFKFPKEISELAFYFYRAVTNYLNEEMESSSLQWAFFEDPEEKKKQLVLYVTIKGSLAHALVLWDRICDYIEELQKTLPAYQSDLINEYLAIEVKSSY